MACPTTRSPTFVDEAKHFLVEMASNLDFNVSLSHDMLDSPDALPWAEFEAQSWRSQSADGHSCCQR